MKIIKDAHTFRQTIQDDGQESLGFVPTMGYLHDGHLSLVKQSIANNNKTLVSIYVNESQFNDKDDFKHYPRDIKRDIDNLNIIGCDYLFLPTKAYIESIPLPKEEVFFDSNFKAIATKLEGKYRPLHFFRVAEVMYRLLQIVEPNNLYMGQKDYQQCLIIRKIVNKFFKATQMHTCCTIRELSGLAMSSRNSRLDKELHLKASLIYKILQRLKNDILGNDKPSIYKLLEYYKSELANNNFKIDYLTFVERENLDELLSIKQTKARGVVLTAVSLGKVRLIDNILV